MNLALGTQERGFQSAGGASLESFLAIGESVGGMAMQARAGPGTLGNAFGGTLVVQHERVASARRQLRRDRDERSVPKAALAADAVM